MITYVSGKLVEKKPTEAVLDVGGIGYRVLIPTSTYEALPEAGGQAMLLTHFYVREDAQHLFGFATRAERTLFELLLGVSGIGPKLALTTLSAVSPADLREHITGGNVAFLTRIPGVGRKTAERLVVELRDRLAAMDLLPSDGGAPEGQARATARADALSALEQLGLGRAAAERSIRKVLRDRPELQSADEIVRLALRESVS